MFRSIAALLSGTLLLAGPVAMAQSTKPAPVVAAQPAPAVPWCPPGQAKDAAGKCVAARPAAEIPTVYQTVNGVRTAVAGPGAAKPAAPQAAPPAAKYAIKESLAPLLARHPGLMLEDKGLTLALHYRLAPVMASNVHRIMHRLVSQLGHGLELQRGKRVVEIKPAGIDKGTAVAEYLAEPPFRGRRAVFIGDDLNDEHGFAEVNRLGGVSIKVGRGASCALFRLKDVASVRRWLAAALKETP